MVIVTGSFSRKPVHSSFKATDLYRFEIENYEFQLQDVLVQVLVSQKKEMNYSFCKNVNLRIFHLVNFFFKDSWYLNRIGDIKVV